MLRKQSCFFFFWHFGILLSVCDTVEKADILFLIDGSGSVQESGFQLTLDFVTNFTRIFRVGPNYTQFGLIVFGTYVHKIFNFSTYADASTLEMAIQQTE